MRPNLVRSVVAIVLGLFVVAPGETSSAPVDAALDGGSGFEGRTYLFAGASYRRLAWATGAFDDGGSLPSFAFHLPPSFREGLDAALAGQGDYARYGYFFKGDEYVAYDWQTWNVSGGIRSLDDWNLPAPFDLGVDAAINGQGSFSGKAYFFRGAEYVRYDWASGHVDAGFPQPLTSWGLSGDFATGLDYAISDPDGRAYFVRDGDVVVYDWALDTVTSPAAIGDLLPALDNLDQPPTRRVILYVTIDPWESQVSLEPSIRGVGSASHGSNLQTVIAVMEGHQPTTRPRTYVDPWWAPDVDASILDDPHVFAVVSGGSYTEWDDPTVDPGWHVWLQAYFERLFARSIPALAICGSHQGMSGALAGWQSVRHMSQEVNSVAICTESCSPAWEWVFGTSIQSSLDDPAQAAHSLLDPPAERGPLYVRIDADEPLFEGIGELVSGQEDVLFRHSHHDEVIDGLQHPDFVRIATSPPEASCCRSDQRSVVQALKYIGSDRVLYSTQFHPDSTGASDDGNGERLLTNFMDLSWVYWDVHDPVPEPTSALPLTLGAGLLARFGARRRRR